jgi:phosphatidylserine/phosphatidylglycerophosphate/cardiolipin synthase-like enzyme
MSRRRQSSRSSNTRRRNPPSIWTVLGILILLLLAYLVQQGYIDLEKILSEKTAGSPPPVVQTGSGEIQAFFTTPFLVYPDVPEQRRPPPHEQALIADIDAASDTIDLAVFEYNLTSVAEALVRAQQRGVVVRLALDRENLEKPEMAAWAGVVEAAQIPIAWEESDAFLHSKFVIIDNALVWMGSWNATNNDTYRNNNNLLRITIPAIVANYAAEFEQMNAGRFGNSKQSLTPNSVVASDAIRIENYFSPEDGVAQHVVERLNTAQQQIDFLAFSYTSDPIADAMIERYSAGVPVRGVFENRNAGGIGAEFDKLRQARIDVWDDGNCYTMHHKLMIIDGRTVITGSYNFTGRAEDTNDENLIIIDDPTLASQFAAEFERVYRQARQPTRCQG